MNKTNDNSTGASRQQNIVISTPYGKLHIEDVLAAEDHASMKARELHAFLVLVSGAGQDNFASLNGDLQNSLLWMLSQAAGELGDLLSQVTFAEKKVAK